jgi:hypothetical protein
MKLAVSITTALGLSVGFTSLTWAESPSRCEQQALASIHFESNESLFVVLTWLNWVGEREEPLVLSNYDDMQADVLKRIQNSAALKPLYAKHKAVYDQYLKGSSPYVRNGLLLLDSIHYGPAPQFKQEDVSQRSDLSPIEKTRIKGLPDSRLLQEFYTALNLQSLWQNTYKAKHDAYLEEYKASAITGVQRAQCFLNMQPTGPVDISFNPLDAFGTSGQASYNPRTGRHMIKLHIDKRRTKPKAVEDVATHEYTHVLMNAALAPYSAAFQDKLQQTADLAQEPSLAQLPIQEVFARSVGYLHWSKLYPDYVDPMVVTSHNPLYFYLLQQEPAYRDSGLSFQAYLPTFLHHYEPKMAAQMWQAAAQRLTAKTTPPPHANALKHMQQQGLDPQALQNAVIQHQAIITPKLSTLAQQTGASFLSQEPWLLILHAFEQVEHLRSPLSIRENVLFIYENPLYIAVSEQLQQQPVPTADTFVHRLFTQFDPTAEAQRWKQIKQRFAEEE